MFDIILFVFATCFDSLLMSIAYGVERIRLPRKAILIIAFCGTVSLGISILLANIFRTFLPGDLARFLSFIILFGIGITTIFQAQLKHYVKKHKEPLVIKVKGISLVIDVFLDEKNADVDKSKDLSNKEAIYLGIALSIDSLASGLAFGIGSYDLRLLLGVSLFMGVVLIYLGSFIGKRISHISNQDFSWFSGCLLIILAFMRLF